MTVGVLLLTLAGLLVSGGLVAAVAAVRGVSVLPAGSPSARGSRPPRITPLHLGALATGVLVLLLTGWPVAALAAAGGGGFLPQGGRGGRCRVHPQGARGRQGAKAEDPPLRGAGGLDQTVGRPDQLGRRRFDPG